MAVFVCDVDAVVDFFHAHDEDVDYTSGDDGCEGHEAGKDGSRHGFQIL